MRLEGKAAHDDLVCPPPVSACDYSACCLALSWTVPAMQGLLRQFCQRSAAAIYSVFGATSLPTLMRYADWRPIILAGLEPDRASGIGQFRSDRFAIMRPFALAQPKPIEAGLSGRSSIGLLCRHDGPCDEPSHKAGQHSGESQRGCRHIPTFPAFALRGVPSQRALSASKGTHSFVTKLAYKSACC
jgi:hypothetical protein